ncbi:hypothetical protein RJ53_05580 [Methanocalculus chunghsingensis]|uniref:Uncharacterized protein n=1 Tax=Methanocalculus chunghsingensis TaxID=156457 RepID=A0A8J7W9A4_9EURY|nr:hypothetical protein [Methanocalculus chunghsingensis]MBR1369000.1 hypothetical protein [Methanocalculus chunghsingensis]
MQASRFFWLMTGITLVLLFFLITSGCVENSGLDSEWDEVRASKESHRSSLNNYLLVYTIGIDLWNIELDSDTPNTRILRTQIMREETFLMDVAGKHLLLSSDVTLFSEAANSLDGRDGEAATAIAWDLRLYDQEMWNAQNAFIGRLSSLTRYIEEVEAGRGESREAIAYLESGNTLSQDAASAISRADAAFARAEAHHT